MISGLLILNSVEVGARDLWWVDDPLAKKGYNVYRAYDYPTNWVKMNVEPIPGHFYRDESTLEVELFTVTENDWIEKGELGRFGIKLPKLPYSSVIIGRAIVATSPDDVSIILDGVHFRPATVTGIDRSVWFQRDNSLPAGGAVSAFPIMPDLSSISKVQVQYKSLLNFVDIYTSLIRTFYTIVGLDDGGHELHLPGAPGTEIVDTFQIDKMDYMQAEMVRRNSWLFEQVGEPAWLLFRKTKGVRCGCTETGVQQPRTACPDCFGVGIVGGYFGPVDFLYIDPDVAAVRTLQEGGVEVERQARSYLGPTPIVQDGDLIIRRNGERLVINQPTYKTPRGVLLMQEFNTTLLNLGDTRYLIPILPTRNIFNPITQDDPGKGEPITQLSNSADKQWENPDKQVGRTITFNRIKK